MIVGITILAHTVGKEIEIFASILPKLEQRVDIDLE